MIASSSSLTGRIPQFPQAGLRTGADLGPVRIGPCGILEESVWSPRGFLELSTISCTCVNNRVNPVEQLEDHSRMNLGQLRNLHRPLPFILETLHGHPHGTMHPEQRIRAQSTESTAPTTTSVLLIRDLSSKQGVWKVGRTPHLRRRSRFPGKDDRGSTRAEAGSASVVRARGMPRLGPLAPPARPRSGLAYPWRRRVGLGARRSRGYGLMSVACARLRRRPIRQDPFEHRH
ncbi:hypothetical protein NG2371_02987 [Nocardia gamkensis]|nr:hypothetical protein [Nocardia gamkensis]